MANFKTYVLDKTITWLLGGDLFSKIKEIVAGLMDQGIPGDKKREIAERRAKELFGDIATFVVNLAIEAAVFILKSRQSEGK